MCNCGKKSQSLYCSNTCREKRIIELQVLYPKEDWASQRQGYANSSALWSIIRGWRSAFDFEKDDPAERHIWTPCRHGKYYEPIALEYLTKKYNLNIRHCGSVKHDNNLIRASPDGIAIWNNKLVNIEVKCPVSQNHMSGKSKAHIYQYQSASNCLKTEQIFFARFLFKEEFGISEHNRGFPPGYWGYNCLAYGYFTNKYRNKYRLYMPGQRPKCTPPENAIKFNLIRTREDFHEPEDVVTPNLDKLISFTKDLRYRKQPSQRQLVDIRRYLKVFANVDEIYIDKFWEAIRDKKQIEIDDQMIRWLGFKDIDIANARRTLKRYLHKLGWNPQNSKIGRMVRAQGGGRNKEIPLLTTIEFKHLCMILPGDRGKDIRNYYIKIEDAFFTLLKKVALTKDVFRDSSNININSDNL